MQGKVKWFNNQEGYGWIMADDSKEYAFNVRDIAKHLNNHIFLKILQLLIENDNSKNA